MKLKTFLFKTSAFVALFAFLINNTAGLGEFISAASLPKAPHLTATMMGVNSGEVRHELETARRELQQAAGQFEPFAPSLIARAETRNILREYADQAIQSATLPRIFSPIDRQHELYQKLEAERIALEKQAANGNVFEWMSAQYRLPKIRRQIDQLLDEMPKGEGPVILKFPTSRSESRTEEKTQAIEGEVDSTRDFTFSDFLTNDLFVIVNGVAYRISLAKPEDSQTDITISHLFIDAKTQTRIPMEERLPFGKKVTKIDDDETGTLLFEVARYDKGSKSAGAREESGIIVHRLLPDNQGKPFQLNFIPRRSESRNIETQAKEAIDAAIQRNNREHNEELNYDGATIANARRKVANYLFANVPFEISFGPIKVQLPNGNGTSRFEVSVTSRSEVREQNPPLQTNEFNPTIDRKTVTNLQAVTRAMVDQFPKIASAVQSVKTEIGVDVFQSNRAPVIGNRLLTEDGAPAMAIAIAQITNAKFMIAITPNGVDRTNLEPVQTALKTEGVELLSVTNYAAARSELRKRGLVGHLFLSDSDSGLLDKAWAAVVTVFSKMQIQRMLSAIETIVAEFHEKLVIAYSA